MLIFLSITSIAFAEDAISTDRPSVGTSAGSLDKGSIQLESGLQRYSYNGENISMCSSPSCDYQQSTFYNMIRIGISPNVEIRPYNDLNITDLSSTTSGIQGKINVYSSNENSHALGILISGDMTSSQSTSSALALWDFGSRTWFGWFNGGGVIHHQNRTFAPVIAIGLGTDILTGHNIYSEFVIQGQDLLVSGGYYKAFKNYQMDFFAIKSLTLYKTWQGGIGFSWKIK